MASPRSGNFQGSGDSWARYRPCRHRRRGDDNVVWSPADDSYRRIFPAIIERRLLGPNLLVPGIDDRRLWRKALKYLQKALLIFQKRKDYKQIGNTLSLIGVIHVKKSANQKALKCFQDLLVMRMMHNKKKETADIAETMHNIGNCEAKEGRFEDSLLSYEEALQIKNKVIPNKQLSIAKTEHCMGLAMLQLGNLDTALEFFEKSLKFRQALLGNNHLDVSFSLHR